MQRKLTAVVITIIAVLACASTASAMSAKFDRSFGVRSLGQPFVGKQAWSDKCEVLATGKLAVSALSGRNYPFATPTRRQPQRLATKIVSTNGKLRGSSSHDWVSAGISRSQGLLASDFGLGGRFVYVTQPFADAKASTRRYVVSVRLPNGKADRRFGSKGKWTFTLPAPPAATTPVNVSVLSLSDGGVLLAINRPDGLWYVKHERSDKLASWGDAGILKLAPALGNFWFLPGDEGMPMLETVAGSLIVGAVARPGEAAPANAPLGLLSLDPAGKPVPTFGAGGLWTPPPGVLPVGQTATLVPSRTMSVTSGGVDGWDLLFASGYDSGYGQSLDLKIAHINNLGLITRTSDTVYNAFSGGDGGFPDEQPLLFHRNNGGSQFAAADMQLGQGPAYVNGQAALWPGTPADTSVSKLSSRNRFAPASFTAGKDFYTAYACGAINTGTGKRLSSSYKKWSKFRPALRRIDLR